MRVPTGILAWVLLAPLPAAADTITVAISDLSFVPAEVTAKVGDTVEWTNSDFVDHTATEKGGGWDVAIEAGQKAELEMTVTGNFAYFCRFHPHMTGSIHVVAK
jgi:plastocyanin